MPRKKEAPSDNLISLKDAVLQRFGDSNELIHDIRVELHEAFAHDGPGGREWTGHDQTISELLSESVIPGEHYAQLDSTQTVSQLIKNVVCVAIARSLPTILSGPGAWTKEISDRSASADEFATILFATKKIDRVVDPVFDALMPTVGQWSIKSLFMRELNEIGFLKHERSDERHFKDEDDVKTTLLYLEGGYEFSLKRKSLNIDYEDICRGFNVAGFIKGKDGRRVGYIQGYLLQLLVDGVSNDDFFQICDCVDQRLTDMGSALIDGSPVIEDYGPICDLIGKRPVLFLSEWEMAHDQRGKGLGKLALEQFLVSLKKSFRGLDTIVAEFSSVEFFEPFNGTEPPETISDSNVSAAKIRAYWMRISPHSVLGKRGRTLRIELQPRDSRYGKLPLPRDVVAFRTSERELNNRKSRENSSRPVVPIAGPLADLKFRMDQFRGFGVPRNVEEAIPAIEKHLFFLDVTSLGGDKKVDELRALIHIALGEYNSGADPDFANDIPACIDHFRKAADLGSACGAFNAAFMMIWKGKKPLGMEEIERLYGIVEKSGEFIFNSQMEKLGKVITMRHRKADPIAIIDFIGDGAKSGDVFCDAMLRHLDTISNVPR